MAESMYAQITHVETLWHEGQMHQAPAALSSIALNTSVKWWARPESLQALVRCGLKDDAIAISRAMFGELPAGDEPKIRLEIAQLLAGLGQAREASALILAIVRGPSSVRTTSALETLATLGCLEEIASLTRDLNVDPGLRIKAASVMIRFGRIEEGKAMLLGLANPTNEIKNAFGYHEGIRWGAAQALSQFPEQRQLVEQVWEEIARTERFMKAYNIKLRKRAIQKLKENKQVRALLDIGSNRSTPPVLRKYIAAALLELGHMRDAEAIARDIGPT
jgi:thioredoxin-like negative regulator of GroEL